MICPNCGKEMKDKSYMGSVPDFSGTADDDELEVWVEKFSCKNCKIRYDGKWNIPDELLPTEKQRKTILFIQNRVGYCGEFITKKQAINVIRQNFEKAKNIPLHDSQYYEDIQEAYGMDAGDFC